MVQAIRCLASLDKLSGSQATVLRSGVECSPCSYVGHGIGARAGCEARTCMKLVRPEQVLKAARRLLDGRAACADEAQQIRLRARACRVQERLKILGVPVDAITYDGWMNRIGEWILEDRGAHHVCTVNPEFIMIAQGDPIFFNILNRAAICLPDGVGLLWAKPPIWARHCRNASPGRMACP